LFKREQFDIGTLGTGRLDEEGGVASLARDNGKNFVATAMGGVFLGIWLGSSLLWIASGLKPASIAVCHPHLAF